MSATLRVSDFVENPALFPTVPPTLRVDARQHPVSIHFSRRTCPDYISEAVRKARKVHARLPPGGILIFLTGQSEITGVCRKLQAQYGKEAILARKKRKAGHRQKENSEMDDSAPIPKVAPALGEQGPTSRLQSWSKRCSQPTWKLKKWISGMTLRTMNSLTTEILPEIFALKL